MSRSGLIQTFFIKIVHYLFHAEARLYQRLCPCVSWSVPTRDVEAIDRFHFGGWDSF